MRVPKAYLINGILLLLAVASWTLCLSLARQPRISAEQQKAEAEAFAASFLYRQLPGPASDIQFTLDGSTDEAIHVQAVTPLIGRQMGPAEWKQLAAWGRFYTPMLQARTATDHQAWKKLGETRVVSAGSGSSVVLQVYETPDGQLGFQRDGICYAAPPGPASQELLDFIHEARKTGTP